MFERHEHPVLAPRADVEWASGAVFNPGAWCESGVIHLLFRAIPLGYRHVMVQEAGDRVPRTGYDNYVSSLGYASSRDGVTFDWRTEPFLAPSEEFDRFGAEDARISKIDDVFLITYTALSQPASTPGGTGIRIGLATTTDFRDVIRHGIVGPPECDKDAVIFPRRISGRIAMLHRIFPDIQLAWFDDLDQLCNPPEGFWSDHLGSLHRHIVMGPEARWEEKKVGAGPTPIETDEGWLLIYHGVDTDHVYRVGLALLDLDDPSRVIARTKRPVMEPETPYELLGDVNNVVFPEGSAVIDGVLHLYYGAADKVIGLAKAPLDDVLTAVNANRL